MEPLQTQMSEQSNWDYCLELSEKQNSLNKFSTRGSQFERPLMEFPGACAGCGETPYMKLMTQLFGDRMYIANATGCAQAMFLSVPAIPLVRNSAGHGPALSNSLFENNAEYSLGMCLSVEQQRMQVKNHARAIVDFTSDDALKMALEAWLKDGDDGDLTRKLSDDVMATLQATQDTSEHIVFLRNNADQLVKKTMWMYGGDGWAYDIGYGGLDHVLASGVDVNILVVDNELYANTGGQASKATPISAVAKFAASGKSTSKKDLAMIAMNYGNVYVAQISMGANSGHVVKVLKEAEEHKGPSLIIAYAPCINHGISAGMSFNQVEQKMAVECGYWPLFRYNPKLLVEGKIPFQLDSKEPNGKLREFMMGEIRFSSLTRTFPETAERLFSEAEEQCNYRYKKYKALAELD
jgi:pyruvate-ferredoxin/flavodoxin oxidoreductase